MSGHSKWNNIKRKKEKTDAQKGKIFTKIGREMAVAVREGGPDPMNNGKLRDLIAKAKANNVPNDNIDRIIKKAAEPIIGGIIIPPVEAIASTAPANSGVKPTFFISGMVKAPVVATLAAELPLMVPIRPLEITATLAGPPALDPAIWLAASVKNSATPLEAKNAPNTMNKNT